MAKAPRLYRINAGDYEELNKIEGFESLVRNLNTTLETIYYMFDNLTFKDNIVSKLWTGTINISNDLPVRIEKGFTNRAAGVTIQSINIKGNNYTSIANAIQLGWKDEGSYIRIYELRGAAALTDYEVTLLIRGE